MSAGDRDTLAELLAEHRVWMGDHSAVCNCGHELPLYDFNGEQFRAHVADVLLASDWLREQRAEAWNDGYGTCLGDFDIAARREARSPNPYRTTEDTE